MANGNNWELKSAEDVAEALDWLRRRMKGKGLVLLAVGPNAVAVSKEVGVRAADAAELIQAQVPGLRRIFSRLEAEKVTRGASAREDI